MPTSDADKPISDSGRCRFTLGERRSVGALGLRSAPRRENLSDERRNEEKRLPHTPRSARTEEGAHEEADSRTRE